MWALSLTSMKYAGSLNTVLSSSTASSPMNVTFNISSKYIKVPVSVFGTLSTALVKDNSKIVCDNTNGFCYINGLCSAYKGSVGNVVFNFGGSRFYNVPMESFVEDYNHVGGTCRINIIRGTSDYIEIGTPFFENFYGLFDLEYKSIGIAKAKYGLGTVTSS
jgi:hypothetical protein